MHLGRNINGGIVGRQNLRTEVRRLSENIFGRLTVGNTKIWNAIAGRLCYVRTRCSVHTS